MKTNIKTNDITLTPAISEYVDKRLIKIARFLEEDSAAQCDIELGRTTAHHQKGDIFRAEIHIIGAGKNIYASEERGDLYTAIDAVQEEVLRELRANKGKRISVIRRSGARVKNMVKGLWPWGKSTTE